MELNGEKCLGFLGFIELNAFGVKLLKCNEHDWMPKFCKGSLETNEILMQRNTEMINRKLTDIMVPHKWGTKVKMKGKTDSIWP